MSSNDNNNNTNGRDRSIANDAKQDAKDLINCLSKTGIFVVPNGELESWIDNGIKQKSKWILPALYEVQNGNAPEQLRDFIKNVNNYFTST